MTSTVDPLACCAPLLAAPLGEGDAEELAAVLRALADPVRLRLLSLLAASPGGEICACDLPGPLGRSQPTISHHLAKLTDAGLVRREQRGKWAWFRLDTTRLATVRAALGGESLGRCPTTDVGTTDEASLRGASRDE